MAVWMAVPSILVVLWLTLPLGANRWTNIVAGIVSMVALVATFFAGELSARYMFQAAVEAALIAAIVRQAWKWPRRKNAEVAA